MTSNQKNWTVLFSTPNNIGYQALVVLLIAAIAIRITAFRKRRSA